MTITSKSAAQLRRLAQDVQKGAPAMVASISEVVVREAKRLAPVRTGALRDSIEVIPAEQTHSGAASGVQVGVDYADEQEFGSDHNEAQPYLRPAVEIAVREIGEVAREAAESMIAEALR